MKKESSKKTKKAEVKLKEQLGKQRDKIDSADHALFSALGKRFKAVEKVGKLKMKHGLPVYQKARWEEVVEDRVKRARKHQVSETFTRALLNLIHEEAIRIQKRKSS